MREFWTYDFFSSLCWCMVFLCNLEIMTIVFYQKIVRIVNNGFRSPSSPLLHTLLRTIIMTPSLRNFIVQSANDYCVPTGCQVPNVLVCRKLTSPKLLSWSLNLTFARMFLSGKICYSVLEEQLFEIVTLFGKKNTHRNHTYMYVCICMHTHIYTKYMYVYTRIHI